MFFTAFVSSMDVLLSEMGKSSHSEVIAAQCRKDIIAKIEERAEALGITKSRYTALILEKWKRDNFPPISKADGVMSALANFTPIPTEISSAVESKQGNRQEGTRRKSS